MRGRLSPEGRCLLVHPSLSVSLDRVRTRRFAAWWPRRAEERCAYRCTMACVCQAPISCNVLSGVPFWTGRLAEMYRRVVPAEVRDPGSLASLLPRFRVDLHDWLAVEDEDVLCVLPSLSIQHRQGFCAQQHGDQPATLRFVGVDPVHARSRWICDHCSASTSAWRRPVFNANRAVSR